MSNKFNPLQNLGDADCTNTNALYKENVKVSDNITRNIARNTKITKGHSNDGPKVASDMSTMIKSNELRAGHSETSSNVTNGDKYSWDLCYVKNKNYRTSLPKCRALQQWDSQNKFKFGFIPLGELKMPCRIDIIHTELDPIAQHKTIKKSGKLIFKTFN